MQPAPGLRPDIEQNSIERERPWLFNFLIAPMAVMSIGLVGGALSYLFRHEGVDPGRSGSILALLILPHAIFFL